jgi:hypothetical protein
METLSFHVPLLGMSLTMSIDFLRFHFHDKHSLVFHCNHPHDPMVAILYRTRKTHREILQFLEDTPSSPVLVEKTTKHKHIVSFDKSPGTVLFLVDMLKSLFPDHAVWFDIYVYDYRDVFGKTTHHLLDLYEMGYLTLTSVEFPRHAPLFHQPKTQVYTGLYVHARPPFQQYYHDFLELDMSLNMRRPFLRLSFRTLLTDYPDRIGPITTTILRMVQSIPLKENVEGSLMASWENYRDLYIFGNDLSKPLMDWQPSLFLQQISRLLDMFSDYYIDQRFSIIAQA